MKRTGMVAAALLAAGLLAAGVVVPWNTPSEEYVVELAPVDLPAGTGHHGGPQPPLRAIALPFDGWLRGYAVELVDAQGRSVPQRLLHHVNLIAPEGRELFSSIMLRIGAAGPETPPVTLPRLFGVRIREGDSLLVTAMLHNPTDRSYEGVRVRVRLPYVPADSRVPAVSVKPFYVDVMPPAGTHDFDLPPGRSETYWEGRPAIGARILGVGGHVHKHALTLRFEDRTDGRVLWEEAPETDTTGEVLEVPTKYFLLPPGITLEPDHVYRLTVVYDNPTTDTIPGGGMGTFGGVLIPESDSTWPALDREHADYLKDLRVTYRLDGQHGTPATPEDGGGHQHH